MKTLKTTSRSFEKRFEQLCDRLGDEPGGAEDVVREILGAVRRDGDRALAAHTRRLDGVRVPEGDPWLGPEAAALARRRIGASAVRDLKLARDRIRAFQRKGLERSWEMDGGEGVVLGQRVHPLERVGVYVPGGKGAYPSTVLMNCVPARVAGVREIILATPPSTRSDDALRGIDPHVVVAADLAGASRVLTHGGAQAVAALAYGTAAVPRVDKIVGPGNIYVATAKRLVYGRVDIDSVAGPSEVLVIADGSVPAAWTAADLLSQAEHDEDATAIVVVTDAEVGDAIRREVRRLLPTLSTAAVARESIARSGTVIVARNLDEAVDLANRYAPEHLELHVRRANGVARRIVNAGAVFVGPHTPEAVGDYLAGPNHVLPTGGTARFFSPLSVHDFVRRSNTLRFSRRAIERLGPPTERLAELEGFDAHARSVGVRLRPEGAR